MQAIENSVEKHEAVNRKRSMKASMLWKARELAKQFATTPKKRIQIARVYAGQTGCDTWWYPKPTICSLMGICLLNHGLGVYMIRHDDDGSSWVQRAWLNQADLTDEDVLDLLSWDEHYDGPGRSYARKPNIERNGHSILVTQYGGLDI